MSSTSLGWVVRVPDIRQGLCLEPLSKVKSRFCLDSRRSSPTAAERPELWFPRSRAPWAGTGDSYACAPEPARGTRRR